jgi:hypothetical protein
MAAVALLIYCFPSYPKSLLGWILLFIFALPITVAGEWMGGLITENRLAQKIENETTSEPVSIVRMIYLLFALLLAFAIYFGCAHYVNLG